MCRNSRNFDPIFIFYAYLKKQQTKKNTFFFNIYIFYDFYFFGVNV